MNDRQSKYYFLGGNTADGFYSLYDGLVSYNEGDFLWVIKGGAGCGKSSFMRKIGAAAQKAGYAVEYVMCSGDPNSLDAIYIPQLKTAYMDGTAPHVTDVHMAAADSAYLDLGQFYDKNSISEHKDELLEMQNIISLKYRKAYSLLSAAGSLQRGWMRNMPSEEATNDAKRRIDGIVKRELGTKHRDGGKIIRRFLSACTCQGICSFKDSITQDCGRVFILESRLGLSAPMLRNIAESAVNTGYEIIICPDPLTPELPEAVLIPGVSLAFVASTSALAALPPTRKVHLDPKGEAAINKQQKSELLRYEKLSAAIRSEAINALSEAKAYHDKMEGIYNPFVDFSAVHETADEHLRRLGLGKKV